MIENYNSLKLYWVQMMENLNKFPIIWSEVPGIPMNGELVKGLCWHCHYTQEKYEDNLDFLILALWIAHLWWWIAQL